jgi:hypothetical protein
MAKEKEKLTAASAASGVCWVAGKRLPPIIDDLVDAWVCDRINAKSEYQKVYPLAVRALKEGGRNDPTAAYRGELVLGLRRRRRPNEVQPPADPVPAYRARVPAVTRTRVIPIGVRPALQCIRSSCRASAKTGAPAVTGRTFHSPSASGSAYELRFTFRVK